MKKKLLTAILTLYFTGVYTLTCYASASNVSGTVKGAFNTYMQPQIKEMTNDVILPIVDGIILIAMLINLLLSWSSYKKNGGEFEWKMLAILFCALIFGLSAPHWIWGLIGW